MQNACKDPLVRHDACADTLEDGASAVAFLADLRDFKQNIAAFQLCADGQRAAVNAVYQQIFAERAVGDVRTELIKFNDFLIRKQADLTMPVDCLKENRQ